MSGVGQRMKSPSFKRKMKVSQSLSTPTLPTSAPPTTTEPSSPAPPLPPMSSHPVLMRRQPNEEFPQMLPQQNYYSIPHTVRNSSSHSQLTNEESTTDCRMSFASSSQAPPLPPKHSESVPYVPFIPLLQRPSVPAHAEEDDNEYSQMDAHAKSLSELSRSPSWKLPMQVTVVDGFQGHTRKSSVSEGEILNLLCLKKRKLVTVETRTGTKVKIPMNSSLQFGILYNPTDNLKQAVKGFHYKTAGDILSLSTLPKLICATKHHKARLEENAVQKGEVLLVNETTTRSQSKRALSCIQVGSGKQKKFLEDCAGQFSTQPESTKMFLPDIVNYIDLPQMAVVFFPERQRQADLNSHKEFPLTHQQTVKITQVTSEKSVLATRFSSRSAALPADQNGRSSFHMVLDIPIDQPALKFHLRQPSPPEQDNIAKLAKELVQGAATMDQHHVRIGNNAKIFDAVLLHKSNDPQQQIVSSEAAPPLEREQFSLELSPIQYPQIPAQTNSSPPLDADASSSSLEAYAFFDPKKSTIVEELAEEDEDYVHMKPDPHPRKSESPSLSALVEDVVEKKLQEIDNNYQTQIKSLREEMANLRSIVEDLQTQCKEINHQQAVNSESLGDVKALVEESKAKSEHSLSSSSESQKEVASDTSQQFEIEDKKQQCRKRVQTLSCEMVLQLLDKMNLGKYKESFQQEQIDGSLLLSCDIDILQSELGITSRLHRVKLLRLIEGDVPDAVFNDLF